MTTARLAVADPPPADSRPLPVVCRCDARLLPKVRYVLDTLLMTLDIPAVHVPRPPQAGPWLLYGEPDAWAGPERCVWLAHRRAAWRFLDDAGAARAMSLRGVPFVLGDTQAEGDCAPDVAFDLVANAFYFLSSWSERRAPHDGAGHRALRASSVYARLDVPHDIVDRYLVLLAVALQRACERLSLPPWPRSRWPGGATHVLVLSHDIDFIPAGRLDIARQGAKSVLRHLLRQRDPVDAWQAACGLARAAAQGRDPYGCIPDLIGMEAKAGVRASFQVAVARRHPADVNYAIEDDRTRDYLHAIVAAGCDLCLHGSYRSTEQQQWYEGEVALLAKRLARPLGSRQHYLSFVYDTLFAAQEAAGIEYDMSMGYPDHTGARAGFSFPYFPYCIKEDRPYRVVEISLFMMDVTLRAYMGLKGSAAQAHVRQLLGDLDTKGGCVSAVWHPIVFGGARDPGYDRLFWEAVAQVRDNGGLATDGRTVNAFWRRRAANYGSFAASRGLAAEQ